MPVAHPVERRLLGPSHLINNVHLKLASAVLLDVKDILALVDSVVTKDNPAAYAESSIGSILLLALKLPGLAGGAGDPCQLGDHLGDVGLIEEVVPDLAIKNGLGLNLKLFEELVLLYLDIKVDLGLVVLFVNDVLLDHIVSRVKAGHLSLALDLHESVFLTLVGEDELAAWSAWR